MGIIVDETGVTIETQAAILARLESNQRDPVDGFGPDWTIAPESPQGQFNALVSRELAEIQQAIKGTADAGDKRSAEGVSLDALADLVGYDRAEPISSLVPLLCSGDPATVIEAGKIVRHNPTNTLWDIVAEVTIGGGGTIAAQGRAQIPGPSEAVTGTDWSIVTSVSGWDSVESTADAVPGQLEGTDPEVREGMDGAVQTLGQATPGAAEQNLQELVPAITSLTILNNPNHFVDADLVPAHAMEAVIEGGDDQDIGDAIFEIWAGGTQSSGNTEVTVEDQNGDEQLVYFTRPVDVELWLRITIGTTGAEVAVPAGADATVETAALALGLLYKPGQDAVPAFFEAAVHDTLPARSFTSIVAEVGDDGVAWQTTPWPITVRQKAKFDSARTTVIVS